MESISGVILIFSFIRMWNVLGDVRNILAPGLGYIHFPSQESSSYWNGESTLVASSTTEILLPEVIDNRQPKDNGNFIPFNHYLPQTLSPSPTIPPAHRNSQSDDDSKFSDFQNSNLLSGQQAGYSETRLKLPNHPVVVLEPVTRTRKINDDHGYNSLMPQSSRATGGTKEIDITPPIRLHIHEMRCLSHHPKGFFQTIFTVETSLNAIPIVDNDFDDNKCSIKVNRNYFFIIIREEDFTSCGVTKCGATSLCLSLRFPLIHGLRTNNDAVLSLHCQAQSKVATKTHAFQMLIVNDVKSKNAGIYAHGGSQNAFRTHIELLRKSATGFTRQIEANDVVQLGEQLLLRAHVIAGDGWNYTKLTDVALQRQSPDGKVLNSINLIDSYGCVDPTMHSICSHPPVFDPPLGHRLTFNAVMFTGMKRRDELLMSIRVTGCLEETDCHISAQECDGRGRQRRRRRRNDRGNSSAEAFEISTISFRVEMPKTARIDSILEDQFKFDRPSIVILGVFGFVLLLCLLGIFVLFQFKGK